MTASARSLAECIEQSLRSNAHAVPQFQRLGFVVLDNVLDEVTAHQLRNSILGAFAAGLLEPNRIQFATSDGPVQLTKPDVYEADLHRHGVLPAVPLLAPIFASEGERLIDTFNSAIPELSLLRDPVRSHVTVKLQVNEGGAFPWHYDNPAPPNRRKLTCAVYLNPDWTDTSGGALVLCPFLGKPIPIVPAFNRVVLFRSDLIVHSVQPVVKRAEAPRRRVCFTIWFDSDHVNADEEVNLRARHLTEAFIPELCRSPLQRSVARAVYDEEYRASLLDCFAAESRDAAIALRFHEAHVAALLRNEAAGRFVQTLRKRKAVAVQPS